MKYKVFFYLSIVWRCRPTLLVAIFNLFQYLHIFCYIVTSFKNGAHELLELANYSNQQIILLLFE